MQGDGTHLHVHRLILYGTCCWPHKQNFLKVVSLKGCGIGMVLVSFSYLSLL